MAAACATWAALALPLPSARAATATAVPPPVAAGADASSQAENLERLGHELDKIDRALEDTKQMIRLSLDAPYLPDLYFHLAELYVQRSRFEHRRGIEAQGSGGRALTDDKNLAVLVSKRLAVETYEKILVDFPDYERRDQIYFFKGHELREMGEWELMKAEYRNLVERLPASRWAQEARLILADHHFDLGEYDPAEVCYQEILTRPETSVAPTARYKLGWVRINQQRFHEALELFREAVVGVDAQARAAAPGTRRQTVNIRREALLAMAWPYSEVRRPSRAPAFFRPLADSKDAYLGVLRKLAARYTTKNRAPAAAFIYRAVLELSRDPEENLAYLPYVVNAVHDMPIDKPARYITVAQDVAAVADTVTRLEQRPAPYKQRPDAPPIDEPKMVAELELQARDMATRAQKFAQEGADHDLERMAAAAYAAYLQAFPQAKDAAALELDRAGALFDAGVYLDSGQQYEQIAGSAAAVREKDIYSAIVAYYRAIDEDAKHRTSDPDRLGTMSKLQLVQAREGLKQLGAYYVHKFSESDNVPDVNFNVARMHYQEGDFAGSVELFAAFVRKYPGHKDVPAAGRLALDALYKLEKYDEMATLADAFAKNTGIPSAEFRGEAARLAEAARKRKVDLAVIGTSGAEFGKRMLAEFEKHKGSKEGEEYLYAGFARYKSEGDIANTFTFGDKLVASYPSSHWVPEVISTMGNFAAQVADFERAAWLYEEYAKRFPRERAAADLLKNAGDMRALMGEASQAEADYGAVRTSGSADARAYVTTKLLEDYAGQAAWGQLAAAANTALVDGTSVPACFYAGLAEARQDGMRAARGHLLCAARGQAQSDAEETLVARAQFELARLQHASFSAVAFRGAGDAPAVLRQKLAQLGDVEGAYLTAVRSGDAAWSMAATYELSRLYREFADFLVKAPAPPGTAAADYRAALDEQAEPYRDKAKQTLAACGQKSEQLRLLSPYGRACVAGASNEVDERPSLPPRAAAAADPKYRAEMDQARLGLQKNLKNVEVLKHMARIALTAGDFHYARLILSSMAEISGRTLDAWMGLTQWSLGDPQAAAETLERARRNGSDAAGLNLAALYGAYGYRRLAKQVMPDAAKLAADGIGAFELHPLARKLLRGGGDA